ncbi:MAG: FKBP-type peptidyl-prolyl cis-trans isomerase [Cryomorphaceae bacterium]
MKNTTFRNILVTGLVGVVAFGSVNILTAQAPAEDIAVPKDVAAAPADSEKTASGLASKVLKSGTGKEKPTAEDTVTVHYSGWEKNGKMFDSSVKRGQPSSFPLNGVIKGWTEGLQLMVVGEKRRFWIPGNLAYGDTPSRAGGPSGTLCFDVELLEIKKAPKMPEVPKNVAAAPANAMKTASGLASIVLKKGTGTEMPKATDRVNVHYSGWDKTGKMFDSSVMRGEPASFPLNQVIKGWTEGMQFMVVGEKRRFWIPADLAYGDVPQRPGIPSGMLCFDVELLEFSPAPKMPEVPADLAIIPENAIESEGGVKSIVITAGKGAQAKGEDVILVNYTGWDKTGKVIDSSVRGGAAVPIPLAKMTPGFSAGLRLMKPGETRQFWIPSKHVLGENPKPGAPEGPFCYQFEFIKVVERK